MSIQDDLRQCNNVFDVAAVLYRECEDRADERRFHELTNDLMDGLLKSEFGEAKRSFVAEIQPLLLRSRPHELISGAGPLRPHLLIEQYSRFEAWLINAGFNVRLAARALLLALDESFTGQVANDFKILYEDRIVQPLNGNAGEGWPAVFIKMPASLSSQVVEADKPLASYLQYLAIIENMSVGLQLRVDSQLWEDLSRRTEMVLAAISPYLKKDDFLIAAPPDDSHASQAFCLIAQESASYRRNVVRLLRAADEQGATVALLPELASSESLERKIEDECSVRPFLSLKLIALGSRHLDCNDKKANCCSIFDRSGRVIWRQCKREAFTIPTDSGPFSNHREWIETEHPQILMWTPIGGVAVQICLDFLQKEMPELLSKLGCRLFLVPSMTSSLRSKFRRAVEGRGDQSGAVSVIANSRLPFLYAGKRVPPSNLRLFYEPVKGNPRSQGEKFNRNTWHLRIQLS